MSWRDPAPESSAADWKASPKRLLKQDVSDLSRLRCAANPLFPNITKFWRSCDAHNHVRALVLIETSDNDRMGSFLAFAIGDSGDLVPSGVDQPLGQPGQGGRLGEQPQIWAVSHRHKTETLEGLDGVLVQDGAALTNDCLMQRFCEREGLSQCANAGQ